MPLQGAIKITKYEKYDKEIIRLFKIGSSNRKIADELGIDGRRVSERLKANNYSNWYDSKYRKSKISNENQKQVLIGTIMGDGCLFKSKKNINYRLNLAHSMKQKEYFLYKYEVLKEIIKCEHFIGSQYDKRTNKTYEFIKFQSKSNVLFTEMHNKWYKNGKKIIPKDLSDIKDLCIAVKYFDDGNFVKSNKTFEIAMCDYDDESINNFRIMLLDKYKIETNVHKSKYIYIPKKESQKFKEIVKPYATNDVLYKLGELLETQ